ncbi:probable protein S-acyltransferase 15 [Andrographis paniculata]|uniref:probable protein S-acyltransferase 15 n=1 Tax=Andrographis paniculata TaxID=175694 RepID=UPI0021E7FFFA|nr:probable protein S-acyltransferase 15 [Andrographis paniculata]
MIARKHPQMMLRRFLAVHTLSALFLLGFVYYTTMFIFIEDWLGLQSSAGLLNSIIFTFFTSLLVFSFFVCILTDPGGVPSGYVPDVEETNGADQEMRRSRKCDKCSKYKPPRSHHCRVCGRCILRMDHHCTWINNCVGHRNYKPFLLLVFYATVASTYSAVVIIGCSLQKDWDSYGSNTLLKEFHVCCGVVSIGLSLLLGSFFGWNMYLVAHNLTTIEHHEANRAAWLARKSGLSYHHPYDVGFYKNITLVMGPSMLKWLWPGAVSHLKDGLTFPTTRESS